MKWIYTRDFTVYPLRNICFTETAMDSKGVWVCIVDLDYYYCNNNSI